MVFIHARKHHYNSVTTYVILKLRNLWFITFFNISWLLIINCRYILLWLRYIFLEYIVWVIILIWSQRPFRYQQYEIWFRQPSNLRYCIVYTINRRNTYPTLQKHWSSCMIRGYFWHFHTPYENLAFDQIFKFTSLIHVFNRPFWNSQKLQQHFWAWH